MLFRSIREQLGRVAHSTLLGMANAPAIELAAELARIAPAGLTKVFYSEAGAAGVEIALKMAFHYWANRGKPGKTKFVAMTDAYHGDTIGAVSVGAIPLYRDVYRPLLFDACRIPYPYPYRYDGTAEQASQATLDALDALLARNAGEIAAVIVEPIVQGASGIIVMPPGCLRRSEERRVGKECRL